MLQQTDTQLISLTASATDAIRNILTERNLDGYALRIYVSGGGGCCGGTQFNMALDNNIRDNDFTYENDGIKVVVDNVSLDHVRGAKIDFVDDPARGAGFLVDSPSSGGGGSCGCGSKGHDEHGDASESACACGGSCAC